MMPTSALNQKLQLEAVLMDFQMAKVVHNIKTTIGSNAADTFTRAPPPRWAAPETIMSVTPAPPADIWSFGMVMLETFTLQVPFPSMVVASGVLKATSIHNRLPERPESDWVTDAVWGLMNDCWKKTPDERPNIQDVLARIVEAEQYRNDHPPEVPAPGIPQAPTIHDGQDFIAHAEATADTELHDENLAFTIDDTLADPSPRNRGAQ